MVERRVVAIRGLVQGVGFRPFVRGLAATLDLRGQVRNSAAGVVVDIEGSGDAIGRFLAGLRTGAPPLAEIDSVAVESAPLAEYSGFTVAESDATGTPTALVAADAATCEQCLAELFDPENRRHRHPFISCMDCGPRFTIQRAIPFDRARTTMGAFRPCDACRMEYDDPADRRFHAQAIACPDCGPTLWLVAAPAPTTATRPSPASSASSAPSTPATPFDAPVEASFEAPDRMSARGDAALAGAASLVRKGRIVAIKGLGGYHLACDARDDTAVRRLRARKHREEKPLAVMVRDLDAARALAWVSDSEAALLTSPARPIVLLHRRKPGGVAEAVAPGLPTLGVMLAYTPLHHLLLAELDGPVVMTSGNVSDEPIAYDDAEASATLGGIADAFLTHDRAIATRADDSVLRVIDGAPAFVRRSRGYAPKPIRLVHPFPVPVLGVGGHLKSTFCFGRGNHAFVSQHIGDLDHPSALDSFRQGVAHHQRLHGITPEVVAHDLHPDYASTRVALTQRCPTVAVQHHHAHVAACAAEHGISEPVLGVAFDGGGMGTDGAVWGGEFLLVRRGTVQRLAHLGYVPLPGGEAAVREPWRMAAAHLFHAYGAEAGGLAIPLLEKRAREWALLRQMMATGFRAPPTSSIGRLFDAVAALTGVREQAGFEAQAAIALEAIADRGIARSYAPQIVEAGDVLIADPAAIVRGVVRDVLGGRSASAIAGAFHNALRDLIVAVVVRLARRTGIRRVALTGGVFQNALLVERTARAVRAAGCDVLLHRRVPCNDGGLALGQAVVAAGQFAAGGS